MCGIGGFFQTEFDFTLDYKWENRLQNMKNSILHRGPDDNSIFMSRHAAFAHTRLSIRDVASGSQPMTRQYMGRYATIVFNGEIYNTNELKEGLSKYDLEFSTTSDTEVILNGYLIYGYDIFRMLNGIFSIAIYDHSYDCLILARDRLGVKPLFYAYDDNILVFGSEQKALFAYGIKPVATLDSFREIFALGPARTPGNGVFKGVYELPPAHIMVLQNSSNHIDSHTGIGNIVSGVPTPYWRLTATPHTDSYEDTVEKVKYLVTDSIKRQTVSDIPICTLLSGGLDSSLVSAIVSKELKNKGITLNTFSFDFENSKNDFKPNSFQSSLDRPFVDIMVDAIKSNHTYLECNNVLLFDYLTEAVDARDLPCMADVESSLLYFCSRVSPRCQVTLTGECADEIFGGYPWFHREDLLHTDHFPWGYDMAQREILLKDEIIDVLDITSYSKNAYMRSVESTPYLDCEKGIDLKRRQVSWLNITWFMATLLNRMDRTSMYSGLEARVPFADHRILEYVYNIPWDMKCHNGITKSLLVEVGKDYLPDEILYRKKSPYPKTYDLGYEALLKGKLLSILSDTYAPINSIIDKEKTLKFITTSYDYDKPWYGQLMSGPQMLAYIIQTNYWMEKYNLKL